MQQRTTHNPHPSTMEDLQNMMNASDILHRADAINLAIKYGKKLDLDDDFITVYNRAIDFLYDSSKNKPIKLLGEASRVTALSFKLPLSGPNFVEGELEVTWKKDVATFHHTAIDTDGKLYAISALVSR